MSNAFTGTDWSQLADQRATLDKIVMHWDDPSQELSGDDQENLEGLQNWIDHLIDYANDIHGEPVLYWLTDDETGKPTKQRMEVSDG